MLGFASPVLRFYVLTFLLQNKTKQYITAIYNIGTEILYFQCLNCLQTRLFCKSIIPEDSGITRRALSNASVKTRFKAILKIKDAWFCIPSFTFWHSPFDILSRPSVTTSHDLASLLSRPSVTTITNFIYFSRFLHICTTFSQESYFLSPKGKT